ncbi:type III polyketide synthase [Aureimonas sp. AU22]|uniref:type III polyketide synthase n=1 Tax=Aureimonas sp. AU22 TaxID=1638162 RepID=UPI000706382F|nr:type III polyketide synthase [Aureimonas sp. AU22]BAT29812.1 chalcone synthase [Aureimonas sp. AU22]
MPSETPVQLLSVATAVPPHVITQREAAEVAHRSFADRFDDFERLVKVFESSGIRKRHAVRPLEWYPRTIEWPERTEAYLEAASDLFVTAAQKALDAAGLAASDVDAVVTVSSTGIATPSIEARVGGRIGLRADVERIPVFGLGCAGGVSGLSIASRLAAGRRGSLVLLVAVEICTLAFRLDKLTKANIVATALFGDGAAACLLRTGDDGIAAIEASGQHTWPDTLSIMGWDVEAQGLGVVFDRAIPPFARDNIAPAIDAILQRNGLSRGDVDRFACHPGGTKVIEALEAALRLPDHALDDERHILAEYGNMSAPTALFVLERLAGSRAGMAPRTLLTAMGPGFTASCVSLTRTP